MRKFMFVLLLAFAALVPARAQSTPPARPAAAATPQTANASPTTQPAVPCGCELALPEVLATVGGVRVAKSDLSAQTQQRLRQIYEQVSEARRNVVRILVNSKLLDAEAKKRGTTTTKLLEQEVAAKLAPPTEAEARAFFDANKARIEQSVGRAVTFEELRPNVVGHLGEVRQTEAARLFAERLRAASQVQVNAEWAPPAASAAERARVLATVNGEKITAGDVDDDLRPAVESAREQAYALVRDEVAMKVNDLLLEQEAQRRKVTTAALIEAEVRSKVPAVTDAQAQSFYDENKGRINGTFEQVKSQILEYLGQQEARKAEQSFAERLRRTGNAQVFVKEPEPAVYQIAVDDQPSKGNQSATVTLVEFTDFQCPACAQTHPVLERLMGEYGDRVRFVVRDFPLTQHAEAFKAAEAAEAARAQGKYWEYIALLFTNQSALQPDKLKEYAGRVGLDRIKFDADLNSGRYAEKVERDLRDANRIGVNATPSLYVNGRRVNERSYEGLKAALDAALKNAAGK